MEWSNCLEYVFDRHTYWVEFSFLYETCKGRFFVYEAQPVWLRDNICILCEASIFYLMRTRD